MRGASRRRSGNGFAHVSLVRRNGIGLVLLAVGV